MTRTPPTTPAPSPLWRWRRNPLRRRSDVVEAWIVLATWILVLLGGVLAGAAAAQATDASFAARRTQVHSVSAVLTDDAAQAPPAASGLENGRVWAAVRWTDQHGATHTGQAKVFAGAPAGTRVTVWTDRGGRLVSAPVRGAEATLQTVLTGALVAPPAAAAVWAAGWAVRTRLMRRRLAEWDAEWKQVGPEWRNYSGGRG
ncbi:Rv1733c family protein [Streptomyces bungoensis]